MERKKHNTVDVNPVFIQFLDSKGNLIEKSPNLKKQNLTLHKDIQMMNYLTQIITQ
jgi:hypothetical protein